MNRRYIYTVPRMKQRSRHRLCVVFSRVPSLALSSAPSLALALRRFRGVLQPQIQNLRFWIFLNFFPSVCRHYSDLVVVHLRALCLSFRTKTDTLSLFLSL